MKLAELIAAEPNCIVQGSTDRAIGALQYDSRKVAPKDVFFAWHGTHQDGHRFIAEVCDRGAAAVVLEDAHFIGRTGPTYIEVKDARHALARMSAAYFGRADQALQMVGITGTNGKTTTCFIAKHLLKGAGKKVGLIGTVRYEIDERILPASRTTPEALDLHEILAQMRSAGCQSVVMEVSSHALDQGRTLPIEFAVGVFTNLTQDHLDYHHSMEKYLEAKTILFKNLDRANKPGVAVLNADDPNSATLSATLSDRVKRIFYTVQGEPADISARNLKFTASGTEGELQIGSETFPLKLPLVGNFNVSNALAAIGVALALGMKPEAIVKLLPTAPQVPGRLERFESPDGVTAVVDYAHTEDGVRKALKVLRELKPRQLIVVIGCGGNRDEAKRPKMALAAVELADHAIFTADNPRDESIDKILNQMETGAGAGKNYTRQPDRREAIAEALAMARPGDIVCVAGKGHEVTQEIQGKYYPFDDRIVVQEFLARRNS